MIQKKMEAIRLGNPTDRKEFITPLAKEIISAFAQKSGMDNLMDIARLFKDLSEHGNLLIFSSNPGNSKFGTRV